MKKGRIGILTYHAAHNYGSMLQSWALLKLLQDNGYDAEDINLRNERQKQLYKRPFRFDSFKAFLKRILFFRTFIKLNRRWNFFESFLREHLSLSEKEFSNYCEIQNSLDRLKYSAILVGSDQIWNFLDTDTDLAYVLPGDIGPIKKFSYAASMGINAYKFTSEKWTKHIRETIGQFDAISVRDEDCQQVLENALNRSITRTLDPTMLLNVHEYDKIIVQPKHFPANLKESGYIFYYTPWLDHDAIKIAEILAKHFRLPIVTCMPSFRFHISNDYYELLDIGPREFLWLLKNSRLVCGKSFHLLSFSLIFHKDFYVIDGTTDSRMKSLLRDCNLYDRSIPSSSREFPISGCINYDYVDKILNQQISLSKAYLLGTLSNM